MKEDLIRNNQGGLPRADGGDLSRACRGTVYILQCANGQYYVGSTTNIARRLDEHLLADEAQYRGAKFTKAHQPVKLVYTEEYENEHEARMREQQLHGWSRAKKEALIRGDIETLKQLSKEKDLS
ncbi:MAG: GIY-YIG nuclease family protein [Prevotella sp.]|nr:GIY-YIG nuclease family protein [Prevotella sp.]